MEAGSKEQCLGPQECTFCLGLKPKIKKSRCGTRKLHGCEIICLTCRMRARIMLPGGRERPSLEEIGTG